LFLTLWYLLPSIKNNSNTNNLAIVLWPFNYATCDITIIIWVKLVSIKVSLSISDVKCWIFLLYQHLFVVGSWLGMINSFFSEFELCKIQILFELRLGLWYSEFVLTLTIHPEYFIQHGFHEMVLNFTARSHFTFIDWVFYNVLCSYSAPTKTTSMYYLSCALPIFTKWK